MKKAPYVTGDGHLADVSQVHFDKDLSAPQVSGIMRFTHTSDALRGLVRDLCDRARAEGAPLTSFFDVSGRSGHSRIGIDVRLSGGEPMISDTAKTLEIPVVVTALNRLLAESLADLATLAKNGRVDIGRLFIPMSGCLSKDEVEEALRRKWLLLPASHAIMEDGAVEIPLENIRYILSPRLLAVRHNFAEMIVKGKHGLHLFQNHSPAGLGRSMAPKEFLVSAVHISLGPYAAFIDRPLSNPDVFHLASRLLDGVRTTGIRIPRQVELYNRGDAPASTENLKVRIRLYPAEERVAAIASRVLIPGKAGDILERGVDFPDLTDIFNPEVCQPLFDEITASPDKGGLFARMLLPEKVIGISWEQEGEAWLPEFQWRLIYEYARGNLTEGILSGEGIPKRLRAFVDDLRYVGGEQKLSKVFVSDGMPPVDTLRVLKRNGIGVMVTRGVECRVGACESRNFRLDQTAYEELVKLEREGVRFYILFEENGVSHVREFYKGLWVTGPGRSRLDEVHTTVAMYGSSLDGVKELVREPVMDFFSGLNADPALSGHLAVAHGSGPGVMKVVDEIAKELGVFRIGVGIDAEEIGQVPNLEPEAVVQFVNLALNTRQDIIDRRSIFKVFNVGGFGTCYEINMALTFMKIGQCLPAPYIFVDPFGFGPKGGHMWEQILDQFDTITHAHKHGGAETPPLGPQWVANCCHLVGDYAEGLKVIKDFIADPSAYWKARRIPKGQVETAHRNLAHAGVAIPPYIEKALSRT